MVNKPDDAAAELLIKEVDEELRQDQLTRIFKRHGAAILGGAVALVLGVAGWQGWNAWQADQREKSSMRYSEVAELLRAGKRDEASKALASLSVEGASGYRLLAQLKLGDLEVDSGNREAAAAIYDKVAAEADEPLYRNLAVLKSAYLKADSADPAVIEKAVEPLAVESSPWRHSARELLGLAALKRGDHAKAGEWFKKIADDPAAPQGIRARAAELLAATGAKAKG